MCGTAAPPLSGRGNSPASRRDSARFETPRDWECFDSDTGKDSAREILAYFIPTSATDFRNWKKRPSYQEAFNPLVADLKSSDSKFK